MPIHDPGGSTSAPSESTTQDLLKNSFLSHGLLTNDERSLNLILFALSSFPAENDDEMDYRHDDDTSNNNIINNGINFVLQNSTPAVPSVTDTGCLIYLQYHSNNSRIPSSKKLKAKHPKKRKAED